MHEKLKKPHFKLDKQRRFDPPPKYESSFIPNKRSSWFLVFSQQVSSIAKLTFQKFININGDIRAAAFAYYAFFSLFPLVVIFVKVISSVVNRQWVRNVVIGFVSSYFPFNTDIQTQIVDTITKVIHAQRHAGTFAFLALVWVAIQFFATMIDSINSAWGLTKFKWWRLPLRSLFLLCVMVCAVFLGVTIPMLVSMVKDWLIPTTEMRSFLSSVGSFFLPIIVIFTSLSLLYIFAPRRQTKFREVWLAAFCATIAIRISENLFVVYLHNFATMNAVYGAFGGMMALLLWIYLSGCIYILGACMCASMVELKSDRARK